MNYILDINSIVSNFVSNNLNITNIEITHYYTP